MELRILITGGGTGGHAMPALATVRAIQQVAAANGAHVEWEPRFLYVGSETGVEKHLADEASIPFAGVKTGKLRRAASPLKMVNRANIADMMRVPVGIVQAVWRVYRYKPDVVFSTGGYVSVPVVLAAAILGVPIVAHEQTVQIGLANKLIMRCAKVIALSYPESADELPKNLTPRVTITGNPVREGLTNGDSATASRWAGFAAEDDNLPTTYITGGAQGSRMINDAVLGSLTELLTLTKIVHQCGKQPSGVQDVDRLAASAASLPPELRRRYHVEQFIGPEIADVYALADLVVGRSGAGTVSEVCALGKAALFVPLVPTGGDEQNRNATRLAKIDAAAVLDQDGLSPETLLEAVKALVTRPALLAAMGERARSLAMPNAARDLACDVINTALASESFNRRKGQMSKVK